MKKIIKLLLLSMIILGFIHINILNKNCTAEGTTIYVDDSGGKDYITIQEAIDASSNGDTIYVYAGIYTENIEINKDLTITGENKDTAIIDGENNGHVIDVIGERENEIDFFHISGFTIQNAGGTGKDCLALSFVNSGNINGNILKNSAQSDGIQIDHCTQITINNNEINDNSGAGISISADSENNDIYDNTIENNVKGIYIYHADNNNIYSNTITGSTIGIHIYPGSVSSNNYFYLNDLKNNVKNAEDPHTNYWSKNSQGNYWDDYTGEDSDNNGIGDTPYDIPEGSNQDLYPLGYFAEENQQPSAVIQSISPNPANQGQTITFNGYGSDSDGTISAWEWKIDGVVKSNSEDFSSSGFSIGTHSVVYRVQDNEGYWSSYDSSSFTITSSSYENHPPTVTIIRPDPFLTKNFGDPIHFYAIGSDPDPGDTLSYSWSSDADGFLEGNQSFYKSDLTVNTHVITLRVSDGEKYVEETRTIIINPDPYIQNFLPIADANGPYSGIVDETIIFDGSGSYDPNEDDEIIKYSWDFGDGAKGTGMTVEHIYSSYGDFTVQLTVTDNHGEQNTNSSTATITAKNSGKTNSKNNDDKWVIPGFEIIIILLAIFFIVFIKKIKKDN